MTSFLQRLKAITATRGRLCVGIDPMPSVLASWECDQSVPGLEKCARGIVESLGERVAVFKPQSAFFEAHGSAGIAVLERVLTDIAQAGALSILDAKRGDIGSSVQGYASAYLRDDSPLAADAITLSPFLGMGALAPAFAAADEHARGVYVLARTSNPGAHTVQMARYEHRTVAQEVVDHARRAGPHVGLVLGATLPQLELDLTGFGGSILMPGIGAQGGKMEALPALLGPWHAAALPTLSRDVIGYGRAEATSRVGHFLAQTSSLDSESR